jgi:integrase
MPLRCTRREGSPFWWLTGTVGGCRVRESTGTDRRELAEERRATREAEIYRSAVHGAPATRRTFASVAASYLEHGGPHTPATLARVRRLLLHLGPVILADDVDQACLDKACAALLRAGPKPATRLREVITPARAVLTHGARRRMCAVPVYEAGRASPARTEWLTPAEVDALAAGAARHLQPLIVFLAGTGARLGEALALDWADVDLQHGRALLRETKNGSDRIVDLCPPVLAAMREDTRPMKRRSVPLERTGRVFRTFSGKPYAEKAVQGGGQIKTGWKAACERAGIKRTITPHGLRHTWASWHYAEHRDPLMLRRDGGWSSVALVERYAHLAPPGLASAITSWRASPTRTKRGIAA